MAKYATQQLVDKKIKEILKKLDIQIEDPSRDKRCRNIIRDLEYILIDLIEENRNLSN